MSTSNETKLKVVFSRDLGPDVMPLLHNRKELDVCAYIDTDALIGSIIPGLAIPIHQLASLKLCLCLSALPAALEAHAQLKLLSGLLGKDAVSASLVALVSAFVSPLLFRSFVPPSSLYLRHIY